MDDEAKIENRKMMTKWTRLKEDLDTIQKSIEEAAKKVAHTTKSDRQKEVSRTSEKSQRERKSSSKMYKTDQEKGAQETSEESQSRSCCEMKCSMMSGEKIHKRKPLTQLCQWQIQGRQRRMEK